MEIKTKSSQNAYEMYKVMNFCNLMKKTGKKGTELSQKKLIFSETHMEFDGRLAVSKLMDTQLTNQTFLQRMKEQILKNTAS